MVSAARETMRLELLTIMDAFIFIGIFVVALLLGGLLVWAFHHWVNKLITGHDGASDQDHSK